MVEATVGTGNRFGLTINHKNVRKTNTGIGSKALDDWTFSKKLYATFVSDEREKFSSIYDRNLVELAGAVL